MGASVNGRSSTLVCCLVDVMDWLVWDVSTTWYRSWSQMLVLSSSVNTH